MLEGPGCVRAGSSSYSWVGASTAIRRGSRSGGR